MDEKRSDVRIKRHLSVLLVGLASFSLCQASEGDSKLAYVNRGKVYEKMGQYQKALADLNEAVELDPNLASAYYNRGVIYGSIGDYERATQNLNRAIALDPSLAD